LFKPQRTKRDGNSIFFFFFFFCEEDIFFRVLFGNLEYRSLALIMNK
jgi:UDP-galactopyranose mutase